MANKKLGIPVETLQKIEDEFLRYGLDVIPASPMVSQEILDAIPCKHLDIPYASQDKAQVLDLYLPPEAEDGNVPLFAFIHGGNWVAGNKRDMQISTYLGLLNHGYAVASIEYRLAPKATYPAQIHDCKAALRFLKAHATEYGIDPDRVAIAGGSAGGHLALLVATTPGNPDLEDLSMGNPDVDTSVRCVVAAYPHTDMMLCNLNDDPMHFVNRLFGGTALEMNRPLVDSASPRLFITPDIPPVFIQAGTADHVVPYQNSVAFAEDVARIAGPDRVSFKLIEGEDHAAPVFKMPSYLGQVIEFLNQHMA